MRGRSYRKVDLGLPGKGNSNCHGARPVHLIITMIKWIRTSKEVSGRSCSPRVQRKGLMPSSLANGLMPSSLSLTHTHSLTLTHSPSPSLSLTQELLAAREAYELGCLLSVANEDIPGCEPATSSSSLLPLQVLEGP